MKRLVYLTLPLYLVGCESLANTPADPANPEGASQLDNIVNTGAGLATAINPLFGGILAAAGLAGYGAWKATKKTPPTPPPG